MDILSARISEKINFVIKTNTARILNGPGSPWDFTGSKNNFAEGSESAE